jgi:TolB-like protein/tetratricopeptide (TPR) repeat protein
LLYSFDNYVLDTDQRELRRERNAIPLQPQVFDLLEYLIRRRDRVVTKDDLIAAIWGGRAVSDSALTTRINAVRTAIGDNGEEQRLLKTLPRKGVRFVAAVREGDADAGSTAAKQAATPAQAEDKRPSVAVLPLLTIGEDHENHHLADALAEDIITELSRSSELLVVSRNSSFSYKNTSVDTREIGRALGVKFVLEGSLRRLGSRVRVVTQLTDANDASHVWAERFDFDPGEEPTISDNLVREVAAAVRLRLTHTIDARSGDAGRHHMTVMSCRLSDFGEREPEAIARLVEAYQIDCSRLVAQFGGVAALRGDDEFEAYFGHPRANERSAECAVRAALAIAEAVCGMQTTGDGRPRIRIGIGTGLAVTGSFLPGLDRRQRVAIGGPVDVARRLRADELSDVVVICEPTRLELGGLFACEAVRAAGTAPLEAWRVVRETEADTRFSAVHEGRLSPLVGREEELSLLARRWAAAKAGTGQIVLLRADGGIGKSRLLLAFREVFLADAHHVIHYACAPHRSETAFFPITDQLARKAGLRPSDPIEDKLARLSELLQLPVPRSEAGALIGSLLSLTPPTTETAALPPSRRKEKIINALLDHLVRVSGDAPLVVEFEDVQWADSASLEFLAQLVQRLHGLRILLIVTARPEFMPPWQEPEYGLLIQLSRLDRRNAAELVAHVAGRHDMARDLVGEILDRAEGVPLFVEELTKVAIEARVGNGHGEVSAIALPTTLEASLAARLDRLSFADDLLQIAATLGRQFTHELINALAPFAGERLASGLERLVNSGLAFRRGTPPDAVYTFKHALVRDAIYSRIGLAARRTLHARVAEVLEQKFPEAAASEPGLLAWHYSEGHVFAKAADYALRAGKQAMEVSAMREAIAQLRLGLKAAAQLPKGRDRGMLELNLGLGLVTALISVRGYADPVTQEAYRQLSQIGRELGATREIQEIDRGIYAQYLAAADFENALKVCRQGLRLGHAAELGMGIVLTHQGKLSLACSWLQRAYSNVETESRSVAASLNTLALFGARTFLSLCLALQGQHLQSWDLMDETLELFKTFDHPSTRAFALSTIARVCFLLGTEAENQRYADELAEITGRQNFGYWLAAAQCYQAWQLARRERHDDATELVELALRRYRESGTRWLYPFFLGIAADIDAMAGRLDAALARGAEALALSKATGEFWYDPALLSKRGKVLQRLGRLAEAEACFTEALWIATRQGARLFQPDIAARLALIWQKNGRTAEARKLLSRHCRGLPSNLPWVRNATRLLSELA